jgi:hypothetical protein
MIGGGAAKESREAVLAPRQAGDYRLPDAGDRQEANEGP